jgi:hypothetical protein
VAAPVYTFRREHVRLAASLTLITGSAVLLIWGFWPQGRTVQVLRLDSSQTALDAADAAVVHPVRALRLEFPTRIRLNDRALVRLAFEVEPEGAAPPPSPEVTNDLTAEAVQAIAEARLDLPGALVRPPDSIFEALVPEQSLEFYWTVVLSAPGEYRGTAWSFLTIHEDSSTRSSRIALGAQNVQMKSITLLGMGGEAARIVGGLCLIGGIVLGVSFVDLAARWISRGAGRGA